MKKIWMVLFFAYSVFAQSYDSSVEGIIREVNIDSLVNSVMILSGEQVAYINKNATVIGSRNLYSPGNNLAADFIKEKLAGYGLETYDQVFSETGRNVYAVQYGIKNPDKKYIICAHYDAVTYYCADDNASGTAAVLEAARVLSKYKFDYTIVYALWDEEEVGFNGSWYYASQASTNNEEILGVINLDMIGWDSNDDGLIEIHGRLTKESTSLVNFTAKIDSVYGLKLKPKIFNPGTDRSDQRSFWLLGYGAICLIEGFYSNDFNPYYHNITDNISRFNLGYFHEVSKLAIGSLASLANSDLVTSVSSEKKPAASGLEINNYPNPFNASTEIIYTVPAAGGATIKIYNLLGRKVADIKDGYHSAGKHRVLFNAVNLPSGIYLYVLHSGGKSITKKMILLK